MYISKGSWLICEHALLSVFLRFAISIVLFKCQYDKNSLERKKVTISGGAMSSGLDIAEAGLWTACSRYCVWTLDQNLQDHSHWHATIAKNLYA